MAAELVDCDALKAASLADKLTIRTLERKSSKQDSLAIMLSKDIEFRKNSEASCIETARIVGSQLALSKSETRRVKAALWRDRILGVALIALSIKFL